MPALNVAPAFRTYDEISNVRRAIVLCIPGISTHVAGTPWRSLTYVQKHAGDGIGDLRDIEAPERRLKQPAGPTWPQPPDVRPAGCGLALKRVLLAPDDLGGHVRIHEGAELIRQAHGSV